MRILVSGGGTGGHVYPILTVVAALRDAAASSPAASAPAADSIEIRYAGTPDGVEANLAAEAGIPFAPIQAGQVRIYNPIKLARNGIRLLRGGLQARRLIADWRPDALFVTGGYVCAPVTWAAQRQDVPILVYLPDITPGLAVERLAGYADCVAVSFPEVARHFPGKHVVVTGYPVRPELRSGRIDKKEARARFDLEPDLPTILIFGGSRGARSINISVAAILPQLLEDAQVIHITGTFDWPQSQARTADLPPDLRARYRPFAYLNQEMADAFSAADLAIARAGAATLGEFPIFELPAILVPLPISGGHQFPNAAYLAERGAAITLPDEQMPAKLLPAVSELINRPERLAAMSAASAALAQPEAADRIAAAILELADK